MANLRRAAWTVMRAASIAKDHGVCPIAASIRAAADQVVPGDGSRRSNEIRADFLAIAAELEAHYTEHFSVTRAKQKEEK